MGTRTAIYCRISDDRTGEAAGVTRQEADCRALAERKGWSVTEMYVDNDVSAYSGRVRPAYRQLLEDIKAKEVDAVVVWHLDRLHRRPAELEEFFEVCDQAGVKNLASVTGDVDLSTHDGRFMARILGAVARKESDDKSRRICRKHEELAVAGKGRGGGTRPFGFNEDRLTINEAEAELVRQAAAEVLAGETLRGMCRDWNAKGIRTVTGSPWKPSVLGRVLTSGRIAGLREHHGQVVAKAVWPAIIDEVSHRRLRALLRDPHRRTNTGGVRYLLTGGLARCGLCGANLIARPRADKRRCYVCATDAGGCGKIRSLADPLEELVADVITAVDTPGLAAALGDSSDDDEAFVDQIHADEGRLAELAEVWATGEISRSEWMVARRAVEERLSTAKKALSRRRRTTALDAFAGKPGALQAAWGDLSVDRRRAIIAAVVDRIEVGPAVRGRNTFDPSRVRVVWRA